MSRIEKALEKAREKRDSENVDSDTASREEIPAAKKPHKVENIQDEAFASIPRPEIDSPFLVAASDPASPVTEQYRKLKSLLVKLTKRGTEQNCMMITSTVGGEGKTLTALNLAVTLAQEYDHTVLLIEADVRRPTILRYLGLENEKGIGLTDCIQHNVDVGETLIKTGIGKLTVMPAGAPVSNPVELFSSHRMREVIAEVKNRYPDRFVIVDTTPLLPFAEPHYLASIVDSIVFVVRQNYTPFDKVKEALASVKNHNLLGVVCNDMDAGMIGNGYYGYYGYYGYKRSG